MLLSIFSKRLRFYFQLVSFNLVQVLLLKGYWVSTCTVYYSMAHNFLRGVLVSFSVRIEMYLTQVSFFVPAIV